MESSKKLQFVPFSSFLDGGFWHKLTDNKLNVYGLDESAKSISGFYFNGDPVGVPCRLNVEYTAFDEVPKTPARCFRAVGSLINTNTIDAFKEYDKKTLLEATAIQIWQDIRNGTAVNDPSLLSRFTLLTFADLKKYVYFYWFAFPCLCLPEEPIVIHKPGPISQVWTDVQIKKFEEAYDNYQKQFTCFQGHFLIVIDSENNVCVDNLSSIAKYHNSSGSTKVIFGFADPSTMDDFPGWPLRNYLALIAYHWATLFEEVSVLCFKDRSKNGVRDLTSSLLLTVKLPSISGLEDCPKSVGWEKNERQKLGPRMVNLSSSMDPSRLAESAVDLNLKLMRWRLLPELDLNTVATTKCLLLGSGTLGCNVARCLLGWGVRKITLVDNGKVSYSNPVRQSLFVFEDCMQGGKPKAEAAAESLKKIFPGVDATGLTLSIPMPGHPVSEGSIKNVQADVKKLEELIQSHDALFLLLDTRESRWLPTLIAAAYQKIVICAALGFDTFLVMRHGQKSDTDPGPAPPLSSYMVIPGDQLGCYFCNDVVAPGNSTRDRTLDQQCTVSRPGISYIASALAVEVLVSVLQHPDGGRAAADTSAKDEHLTKDLTSNLGLVPHQIRCFMSRYNQVLPACRAFDKCTACSKMVVDAYKQGGFEFLLRVFNETSSYLEDLTGLTAMHQETLDTEVLDFSDDEDICMDSS